MGARPPSLALWRKHKSRSVIATAGTATEHNTDGQREQCRARCDTDLQLWQPVSIPDSATSPSDRRWPLRDNTPSPGLPSRVPATGSDEGSSPDAWQRARWRRCAPARLGLLLPADGDRVVRVRIGEGP